MRRHGEWCTKCSDRLKTINERGGVVVVSIMGCNGTVEEAIGLVPWRCSGLFLSGRVASCALMIASDVNRKEQASEDRPEGNLISTTIDTSIYHQNIKLYEFRLNHLILLSSPLLALHVLHLSIACGMPPAYRVYLSSLDPLNYHSKDNKPSNKIYHLYQYAFNIYSFHCKSQLELKRYNYVYSTGHL